MNMFQLYMEQMIGAYLPSLGEPLSKDILDKKPSPFYFLSIQRNLQGRKSLLHLFEI